MPTPPTFVTGQVLTAAQMNTIGMHLIKTQTIPNGAGTAVVTGAFSSDYDNYPIKLSGVASGNGGQSIAFRLNNSSGATYLIGGWFANFGSSAISGYGPAVGTSWTDIAALDTATNGATIELFTPFLTSRTTMACNSVRTGASSNSWYMMTGVDTSAVSNTGFTIFPVGAGTTFTGGTIRVYGYRN